MPRQQTSSGTPWEVSVGYSRAVRVGNQVFVSGTTASDENGRMVFVGDAYEQTRFILKKIAAALSEVRDIPRTMLRYAIEKFPEQQRKRYLDGALL